MTARASGTSHDARELGPCGELWLRARKARWAHVGIATLRIFLGFAFVPAGLKKMLAEPFTDPHLSGPFHDFLHAFYATGWFYRFVGLMQLVAALLLISQRFARLGTFFALPILTTILAFCWSTKVYPTATVVTLMWLGTLALVAWDWPAWRALVARDTQQGMLDAPRDEPIDLRLWQACGIIVMGLYLATCAATGSVYRPRGAAWGSPAFYVFPTMLLFVLMTFGLDHARLRARRRKSADSNARR